MNNLDLELPKHSKYKKLVENIMQNKEDDLSIIGLTLSQKAHMIYSLSYYTKKSAGIFCSNNMQAKKIVNDLKFYADESIEIIYMPAKEIIYYDIEVKSKDLENQRILALKKILSKKHCIIVSDIETLSQDMFDKKIYDNLGINIKIGDTIDTIKTSETLIKLGYNRCDTVEGKGQFAIRGGIIDVYSTTSNYPNRIELFGDEVDSIREFDIISQRSVKNVEKLNIDFSSEYIFTKEQIQFVINKLEEFAESKNINNDLKERIYKDINDLEEGNYENKVEKYFNIFNESIGNKEITLLDYLEDFVIYIDEPQKCYEKIRNVNFENIETLKLLAEKDTICIDFASKNKTFEEIEIKIKHMINVYLETINTDRILHAKRKEYSFSCREVNFFRSSMDILIQDIKRYKKEQKIVLLVYPTDAKVEQIKNVLENLKYKVKIIENINKKVIELNSSKIYITKGILSNGFEYEDFKLVVIVEQVSLPELKHKSNTAKNHIGQMINTYEELEIGDFVVHINHGIGKYLGIETIEVQNKLNDYIKLEYESGSVLYIPITQLDSIKKYSYKDGQNPALSNLGTKKWQKTKHKAIKHIELIADELVELYAKRQKLKGFSFLEDEVWQKEFENTFKYELTVDQKIALDEIKEDMEKLVPMDRLLCGDVGYGKTEVAIRAAFKAVMSSKQVAYLVPTTVLCLQQYRTFKERMEPFGIKVEFLSRFKTKTEQNKILKKLKSGEIDVIIGTHRILSDDIIYNDLGFLIIDEEHRFGVKAKEKIKMLRQNLDVLSMTATPIPRTLHMSLIGIREMSTLTEPPLERIPVHTFVLEYNEDIIKNAIERELSRNGQVFYINNRVENIEEVTKKVRSISGSARVAFAHGQMSPDEIEDIMIDFMEHKIDILVCTTILESGIDIQNANTIIIENADRLGLAQLYQIRGRVGRSSRLAYAYITFNKDKIVTEVAEKRLRAIKDFTEFGSGYKIALKDLEIRGAGSILGTVQHGHVAEIGYDLYVTMLERAINKRKEERFSNIDKDKVKIDNIFSEEEKEVKIDVEVTAYIPSYYIKNELEKIKVYQSISNIKKKDEIMDLIDELIDKYGELPKEVENLFKIVEIRNMCRKIGIESIIQTNNYINFKPCNLKFWLTNENNNDILSSVQLSIEKIDIMLKNKES